jgi:hypothetical protein
VAAEAKLAGGRSGLYSGSDPDLFRGSNVFKGMRMSLTYESSSQMKDSDSDNVGKNRTAARLEYSKYFLENCFLQFDGKETVFLRGDHRHGAEGTDTRISQAYIQTSFGKTSVGAGMQTVAWGESILSPITDEVSPRDNREAFNFNLEELRVGQPMLTLDQYSGVGRWSFFYTPVPAFNQDPQKGTLYYVPVPFSYSSRIEGDQGGEYGVNWRKSFGSADVSVMAASLIDNEHGLRMDEASGLVTRVKERFSMVGMTFSYAIGKFLLKGEGALKSPKAYNDAQLQIVKRDEVDGYLAAEYQHSASLSLSLEAVNQHIEGWTGNIQSEPRDRQSLLLSVTKLLMHDDLKINVLNFYDGPYHSYLTILQTSFKWSDNLSVELDGVYPYTRDDRSPLWSLRDKRQATFKLQYQF